MLNPLLLLRIYNTLYTVYDECVTHTVYIWETLVNAYTTKTHVFFEGIATPYLSSAVNVGAPSSAVPLWHYRADTKTFVEWSLQGMTHQHAQLLQKRELPILSMTVIDGERTLHDLTDFIGPIQVFHSNPEIFPSIAHILAAWSLSSGIVLNQLNTYSATIITSSADTVTVSISNNEYLHSALAEPAPQST
jgi:hypothetical protein